MAEQYLPSQQVLDEVSQPIDPYRASILAKIDVAWGSNVGDQGYADPYEVAARTYDALYRPDAVAEGMDARAQNAATGMAVDELPSRKLRPETSRVLAEQLQLAGQVPLAEVFVPTVASAILRGADVACTVLPGAREQIQKLVSNGDRPAIWSAGYPEHQHRKLGKTGLYDALAIKTVKPPVEIVTGVGEPIELLTAIATDKMAAETIARVRDIAGDSQIVVVDDRVKNLQNFRGAVPETKAALWVQYGAHAQKEIDKLARGENPQLAAEIAEGSIIPLANINQLAATIAKLRVVGRLMTEQATVFLNYDDTVSNNTQRRAMELEAAVNAILENGWA